MVIEETALRRLTHLNLIEFCREAARWSGSAGRIDERDGIVLFATGTDVPMLFNGAFRLDPSVAPEALLDRAHEWFGELGRGFTVWADESEDDDPLAAAALRRGMSPLVDYPQMIVRRPVDDRRVPDGAELRWVGDPGGMADFAAVNADAYSVYGMPGEAMGRAISDSRAFTEPHVHSVVAYLDGAPAAAAQTILSHGVAGVYWVGTVESARGRGLGDAVTRAVTNRAFELGAACNSLQASPMGEPIYAGMGYETAYRYRGFVRFG